MKSYTEAEIRAEYKESMPVYATLESSFTHVLDRFSAEKESDTPDHILADYLIGCLHVFNVMTRKRDAYYNSAQKGET